MDFKDAENSVIAFARKANEQNRSMLCVCNFTPVPRPVTVVVVRATTDCAGRADGFHGFFNSISLTLPPLSVLFLKKE